MMLNQKISIKKSLNVFYFSPDQVEGLCNKDSKNENLTQEERERRLEESRRQLEVSNYKIKWLKKREFHKRSIEEEDLRRMEKLYWFGSINDWSNTIRSNVSIDSSSINRWNTGIQIGGRSRNADSFDDGW